MTSPKGTIRRLETALTIGTVLVVIVLGALVGAFLFFMKKNQSAALMPKETDRELPPLITIEKATRLLTIDEGF